MHPPAYMNEILFGQKNFLDNKENFLLLIPHMLTHDSKKLDIMDFPPTQLSADQEPGAVESSVRSRAIEPWFPAKDTLFWSIFIAINGEQEYYKLKHGGHNMTNVMMNLKKEISDRFNKNPEQLKLSNHRITLAKINEIKCNLMTKPMDSIESCIPCAIYFNRPIIVHFPDINAYVRFVSKNYVSDDDKDETIYLTMKNNKIALTSNTTNPLADSRRKPSLEGGKPKDSGPLGFELYHYEKPLQGASNYKGDDLKNIYNTIFPSQESEAMKKTEYFETIMVKCSSVLQTKLR